MKIRSILIFSCLSVHLMGCGSSSDSDIETDEQSVSAELASSKTSPEQTEQATPQQQSQTETPAVPTQAAALELPEPEPDTDTIVNQQDTDTTINQEEITQSTSIPAAEQSTTIVAEPEPTLATTTDSTTVSPPARPEPVNGDFGFNLVALGLLDGNSTAWEQSRDVAFDSQGNIYVVGGTSSADFPVTPGAYDVTYNKGGKERGSQGNTDAFVAKIDPTGNIIWLTYLGGPNYDRAYAVEVDDQNNVYVAGRAGNGFPTTSGAVQRVFAGDSRGGGTYGNQDGFITKLSSDGSSIIWSTYFGTTGPGFIRDIDIDSFNRIHIGATAINGDMSSFVTPDAAQRTQRGDYDSFYARLSADGSTIEYGTYLGGNDTTGYYSGNPAVRALPDGTAYFMSNDPGPGAPTTTNALQPQLAGSFDYLVAKFTPDGNMPFCTYVGGSGIEVMDTHSLALTPGGNAVIVGYTDSSDYPVTSGFDSNNRNGDIAMSVLSTDGQSLLASRLLGGSEIDSAEGVDVDSQGNIYISGNTYSANLPVTQNALVPDYVGERSGLLGVLTEDLKVIRYLSYDGIPGQYAGRSTAIGPDGQWAFVGDAWHIDPFPGTTGQDTKINGSHGAFFGILDPLQGNQNSNP